MCDAVAPHFADSSPPVRFPQPYDASHPELPPLPPGTMIAAAGTLVTKNVLIMDRCHGATISDLADGLVAQLAASRGLSADTLRADQRRQAMTVAKDLYGRGACGPRVIRCLQEAWDPMVRLHFWWMEVTHVSCHASQHVLHALLGCAHAVKRAPTASLPQRPIGLQLGPGLVDRVFEVHAYMTFDEGAFNADPHPGNVLLDPASGALALLDYGQFVTLTLDERIAFAYMIIAADTADAELAQAAYVGFGFDAIWHGAWIIDRSGRSDRPRRLVPVTQHEDRVACSPPPDWVCLNHALVHFGSPSQALAVFAMYGVDPFAEHKDGKSPFEAFKDVITILHAPPSDGMLQRMSMCLRSVATAVGLNNVSVFTYMAPHARRWLRSRRLGLRDLQAASRGKAWHSKEVPMPKMRSTGYFGACSSRQ